VELSPKRHKQSSHVTKSEMGVAVAKRREKLTKKSHDHRVLTEGVKGHN